MNWNVYIKNDISTWPEIDCPVIVYKEYGPETTTLIVCTWDINTKRFYEKADHHYYNFDECYYAYIGYVPCGYKAHKLLKCVNDIDCKIGCSDDGYCMYDFYNCKQQRKISEYEIEEKRIWKEFE